MPLRPCQSSQLKATSFSTRVFRTALFYLQLLIVNVKVNDGGSTYDNDTCNNDNNDGDNEIRATFTNFICPLKFRKLNLPPVSQVLIEISIEIGNSVKTKRCYLTVLRD